MRREEERERGGCTVAGRGWRRRHPRSKGERGRRRGGKEIEGTRSRRGGRRLGGRGAEGGKEIGGTRSRRGGGGD
eukprot:360252-Chlamydomonas_euryale.AAC.2